MNFLFSDIRRGLASLERPGHVHQGASNWRLERIYQKSVQNGHDIVLRASAGDGRTFAVKANLVPERNERQYAAQQALRAVTLDSIAPRYLDPNKRFFISDWCDAPLLLARMHDSDRRDALKRAGIWLRVLHKRTRIFGTRQDTELTAFRLPPKEGTDADIRLASARLLKRRARLGTLRSKKAMLHGDYQLQNLFDSGQQILGFDRPRHRIGSVFFDVARFCLSIELHRGLAKAAGTPWSDDLASDRRSFYEGYGAIPSRQVALHDLVEDLMILRNWHHFHVRPQSADCRRKAALLRNSLIQRGLLGTEVPGARPGRLVAPLLRSIVWTEQAPRS